MKKIILMLAVTGMIALPVAAEEAGPGCGLGQLVYEGNRGWFVHMTAATTNSSTMPFAVTSQTSGCDKDSTIYMEQLDFVAINFDNLSTEMARGHGQYLDSLASLMGCSESVYSAFSSTTQEQYEILIPSAETDAEGLLTGLRQVLQDDPNMAANCTRIS